MRFVMFTTYPDPDEWPSLKDPGARVELWPTFIRTPEE